MPRFRFFGGKGGVGKTTCAAAFALALPRHRRVLLASTDPAHSLGDALKLELSRAPRRITANVDAVELDADGALDAWFDERRPALRTLLLRGTYFDEEDVDRFLGLSLPGVDELVGLRELQRLGAGYDEVVVDTAPTGHTLRLLEMPETLRRVATVLDDMQAKHRVIVQSLGGRARADEAEELVAEIDDEGASLAALLRDPARASFSWVLLPEELSVAEAEDGLRALREDGIAIAEVVVNRVTPPPATPCALCDGRRAAEKGAIAGLAERLGVPAVRLIAAAPEEPRGIQPLRRLKPARPPSGRRAVAPATGSFTMAASDELRLLIFGGKGGVGKTTCAATAAVTLAERHPERRVLVLSTDPAHSLGDAFACALDDEERAVPGAPPNLRARELDAEAAFARKKALYRDAVESLFDELRPGKFDATYDRRVTEDLIELAPPGIDEIFAILGVMDALDTHDLIVLDTAPTGHALRLLEMPARAREWVKALLAVLVKYDGVVGAGKLGEELVAISKGLRKLEELLGDARRAKFVAVTRPAELPGLETERLRAALDRLGVALSSVIVNAVTPSGCPRCTRARAVELRRIASLEGCATILAPCVAPPPRGAVALRGWGRSWALR